VSLSRERRGNRERSSADEISLDPNNGSQLGNLLSTCRLHARLRLSYSRIHMSDRLRVCWSIMLGNAALGPRARSPAPFNSDYYGDGCDARRSARRFVEYSMAGLFPVSRKALDLPCNPLRMDNICARARARLTMHADRVMCAQYAHTLRLWP